MSKVSNTSTDLILIKQLRVVKASHSKVMKQLKKHFVEKRRDTRYNKHVYQTLVKTISKFISEYIVEISNKQDPPYQTTLKKHLIQKTPDIIQYLMNDDYIMDRFDLQYGKALKQKFLVKQIQNESRDFILYCEKDNIIKNVHEHIDTSVYTI